MCYHVLLKGYIHCKGFLTFLTFIEFFSSVDSFMVFKRTGTTQYFIIFYIKYITQYFRTCFTYILCLSFVMTFVDPEVIEIIEGFTTLLTFIACISSVNCFMYLDTFRTFKGFSTLFTLIGLLSIVNAFMHSKMTGIKKMLSHISDIYTVNLQSVLPCFQKPKFHRKVFPHFLHSYGFSPV